MKSDNFVIIQGWMCNELALKGNELLVYALIYGFSQDGVSKYSGGRKYIADTFNISLPTVDKALQGLVEKRYIIKFSNDINGVTFNEYVVDLAVMQNLRDLNELQNFTSSKETLLGGSKETLHNNTSNKVKENNLNNTDVLFSENPESFLQSTSKPKKKGLFQTCIDLIMDFTEDEEVRELLIDYLKMRLEITDKKFGANTFKGYLKKLRTLTESKAECLKIIQQAIDRQYLTFYPLKEYDKRTKRNFESMDIEHSVHITEQEREVISIGMQF